MPSTESKTKPNSTVAADPSTMIASFWTQWLEQSSRGTQAILEAMQTAGDPHQFQRRWLTPCPPVSTSSCAPPCSSRYSRTISRRSPI